MPTSIEATSGIAWSHRADSRPHGIARQISPETIPSAVIHEVREPTAGSKSWLTGMLASDPTEKSTPASRPQRRRCSARPARSGPMHALSATDGLPLRQSAHIWMLLGPECGIRGADLGQRRAVADVLAH